jgi:mono/diheme cytochrome c family protein
MTPDDVRAVATYLKSQVASDTATHAAPDAGAMRRGAAIYSDVCAACHFENGVGQPRYFPPLGNNAILQQADATGFMHLMLAGSHIGTSPSRPSALTMPSFAWKLSDAQIADVGTYVRNSWGNEAAPLRADDVRDLRKRLGLTELRLTQGSGDHK